MRAWVVGGVCAGALLVPGTAMAAPAAVAFHGTAVLAEDRTEVLLTPRNGGSAEVADATVRLRWSVPLAERQELPARCVREDERTVLCATGPLAADTAGERLRVPVRLRERPSELTLEVETAWSSDVPDQDRAGDRTQVLVLATGDEYAF
ncbi:hypothetical protein AB0E62_24850 [Streptomyces sp. NPDC038707]|uniref:hypothetical protein n=1 Tax=unclassified Streptomyces TaxID=2593676 RepID=UPI003408DF30